MLRAWSVWVCTGLLASTAGCFAEAGPGAGADGETVGSDSVGPSTTEPTSVDPTSGTGPGTASVADSSSGASDDTRPGTSDSGDLCPTGQAPNPPLPAEWEGPFVLFAADAGPPQQCPEGLIAPPASSRLRSSPTTTCECTCAAACSVETFLSGTGCDGVSASVGVGLDCVDLQGTAMRFNGEADIKPCEEPEANAEPVTWTEHSLCAGDQNATCVPRPANAVGPCIRSEGDVACPDDLPRKILGGQEATAECEMCSDCNEQASLACGAAEIAGFGNAQCLAGSTSIAIGECVDAGIDYVRLSILPELQCSPAAATTTIVSSPVTYCCASD